MAAPQKFAAGVAVWIPDEKEVFVEGAVVSQDGDQVVVRKGEAATKPANLVTVSSSDCYAKEDEVVDDMTKLVYLHEPGVLNNLTIKYGQDSIYTYTGSILIAVNPFQRFPEFYNSSMRAKYQKARLGELPPHVFAVADSAYRAMMSYKQSQSILISGESGAGKTETTKLVMEYLASVGGRAKTSGRSVESQVLESNPLLEAFGNAKTIRNNNSSRFGKYIKIQFNKWGRVSGASIKSYLLERSRVVTIADPERNYHCFYQLCYGASPEEVEIYKLPPQADRAKSFNYLNQSSCFELDGVSNAEEFCHTKRAMDIIGISKAEQTSIFKIVSAILHLGNIDFVAVEDDNSPVRQASEACTEHLQAAAQLLGCDVAGLEKSLVYRFRKISGQIIPTLLDVKGARTMRDSLAKNLFSKLFDWIVAKVNNSIGEDHHSEISIGVLDIYGFEHFKVNSFEQFCINLANEKLQQHFNMHVLKMEQEEYEREEINWSRIPFSDNQDCLDLIEKDKGGILSILDSDCKLGTKAPKDFTRTLQQQFSSHRRFYMGKSSRTDFTLEHYAGKVTYSTEEFMSKNLDAVNPEHHKLLSASTNELIASMFPKGGDLEMTNQFMSLGLSFKKQLAELMETLNETEPMYIRCVKPNSKNQPRTFERQLVMTQLRSGGVLEAVRMCSAGYPTRRAFQDFADRFRILARMPLTMDLSEKKVCQLLMERTNLSDYQIGKTKIFLRAGQMVQLDTLLSNQREAATKIQKHVRRFWFLRERSGASLRLQTWWRGVLGKLAEKSRREAHTKAALVFQKNARMRKERAYFLALKRAAKLCQKLLRQRLEDNMELAMSIRAGVDRKLASKAERFARAKLDAALAQMRGFEAQVDQKARELVGLQADLALAREAATGAALAVEKITGEREAILDSLMAQEEEERREEKEEIDLEMRELQERLQEMQDKLAEKEQEVKALSNRLAAIPTNVKIPEMPLDEQQATLLREIGNSNLGFENGHAVAASMVFKALLRWKIFEAERTNTFDRVVYTFQQAARNGNYSTLSYWLSNTITLYYLVDNVIYEAGSTKSIRPFSLFSKRETSSQRVEHVDTMLFKLQLGTSVERLYVTIRDSVKAELNSHLTLGPQPMANGDGGSSASTPNKRLLSRNTSSLRAQVDDNWRAILDCLKNVLTVMRRNYIPPLLVHFLLKQLLNFIDTTVFNSLMVRSPWCPCTYSNGVAMGEGLSKVIEWLSVEVDEWLAMQLGPETPPLKKELCHIQQAIFFLLIDDKPKLSLEDIRQLCPALSMNQLVHICIWYDDDKRTSQGVEPAVIELMWAHMLEDSPMQLREDDRIPFGIDEIVASMMNFEIDEVQPPGELLQAGLHFLLQNTNATHSGKHLHWRMPSIG